MRVTHRDTQMMMAHLLSQRENVAKYWVTVTAGQTHTINSLGITAGKSVVVTWGDGLSNEYTYTAARTHVYASAGTYAVKIYTPENVMAFYLRDGAAVSVLNSADLKTMANINDITIVDLTNASITLNSADLKGMVNVNTFNILNLPSASITINSADWVDWRPSNLNLNSLPGASITINSADWVDWRPSTFNLNSLPGASITFNSADMVDWRPSNIGLAGLPSATITIAPSTIKNWSGVTNITLRTGNLTQAQANLVLWECYQITRTATSGTINLAYAGNASPSGTLQACQSPPVSASTPGKEIAYELLNDSLGVGFNKWATVSTN